MKLRDALEEVEKTVVLEELKRVRGNIVMASKELGVSRPKLYELIAKHGIDIEKMRRTSGEETA